MDGSGNAYLTGSTNAANFPTRNAYGACANGSPFVAKVARGTAAREGGRATLTVNTRLLHAFDLESGDAIAS